MTATEKLAEILKQFVITPQSAALEASLKELQDIHKSEAVELQGLRDDYQALTGEFDQASAAIGVLNQRVSALEARNASDDKVVEDALAGFTGQTDDGQHNPGGGAPLAGDEPAAPEQAEVSDPVAESEHEA